MMLLRILAAVVIGTAAAVAFGVSIFLLSIADALLVHWTGVDQAVARLLTTGFAVFLGVSIYVFINYRVTRVIENTEAA